MNHLPDLFRDAAPDVAAVRDAFADDSEGPLLAASLLARFHATGQTPPTSLLTANPDEGWDDKAGQRRWLCAACTIDDPAVDSVIDTWLDGERAPLALDALVRAGIDWQHQRLGELLGDKESQFGAAWLLASGDQKRLRKALWSLDDPSDLLVATRAIGLRGNAEQFPLLFGLRRDLADDLDESQLQQLDAAVAAVAPLRYGRALLAGDVDAHWLSHDRLVADFLCVHGTSPWVDALAIFRDVRDRQAYDLAALFATSAVLTEAFDDIDEKHLDPLDPAKWIDANPQRIAFHLAISNDDECTALLTASTLSQALRERQIQPPALPGLPLSGPAPEDLEETIAVLDKLSMDEVQHRVALVRTLSDLSSWVRQGLIDAAEATPVFERYASRHQAAQRALSIWRDNAPLADLHDWGSRGIHHATWLEGEATKKALRTAAQGYLDGPLARSPLYDVIFSEIYAVIDQS